MENPGQQQQKEMLVKEQLQSFTNSQCQLGFGCFKHSSSPLGPQIITKSLETLYSSTGTLPALFIPKLMFWALWKQKHRYTTSTKFNSNPAYINTFSDSVANLFCWVFFCYRAQQSFHLNSPSMSFLLKINPNTSKIVKSHPRMQRLGKDSLDY